MKKRGRKSATRPPGKKGLRRILGRKSPADERRPAVGGDDPTLAERLRELLTGLDYPALVARSAHEPAPPENSDSGAAHDGAPSLLRLFVHGLPVSVDAARRTLEPLTLDELEEASLCELRDGQVFPLVKIHAYQNLMICSDTDWSTPGRDRPDAVMGLPGSSRSLANLTIRRRVKRSLDVGTGGGFQALLAAPHSDQVVAVDVNPRALDFGRFNARLNGITNVEFREGNLFEPVEGEKFDLIVSNPPFVISPDHEYLCSDNAMEADAMVQQIAETMPKHLEEGGYGQMVGNWVQAPADRWPMRLADWFRQSGCDTWVLRGDAKDAAGYAVSHLGRQSGGQLQRSQAEWLSYLQQKGIESIGSGLISLRRVSGRPNWFRVDELPKRGNGELGSYVDRGFAAADYLSTFKDSAVALAARPRAAPSLRIAPQLEQQEGSWQMRGASLHLTEGLCYTARVDNTMMNLVMRLDGTRSLGELLEEAAKAHQQSVEDLLPKLLPGVRQLIARGFLDPPGAEVDAK